MPSPPTRWSHHHHCIPCSFSICHTTTRPPRLSRLSRLSYPSRLSTPFCSTAIEILRSGYEYTDHVPPWVRRVCLRAASAPSGKRAAPTPNLVCPGQSLLPTPTPNLAAQSAMPTECRLVGWHPLWATGKGGLVHVVKVPGQRMAMAPGSGLRRRPCPAKPARAPAQTRWWTKTKTRLDQRTWPARWGQVSHLTHRPSCCHRCLMNMASCCSRR